MYDPSIA